MNLNLDTSLAKPCLSKSRLISVWQCSKKLHLEAHQPELAETSAMAESLFATGDQVGEIAKQVFGSGDGVEIPYSTGLSEALGQTAELVANGHDAPKKRFRRLSMPQWITPGWRE